MICQNCGVENCNDVFMLALTKEFGSADYGAVHHLTVPCYYLQHNLYSKKGWLEVRKLLFKFIYDGLTPEIARKINNVNYNGNKKGFSIINGEKFAEVEDIKWSFTIAGIDFSLPNEYRTSIINWAKGILTDTEQLIKK